MKISEFIADSGWSKSEIAQKLGVSKPAVSKWDEIPRLQLETLLILLGRTAKPDLERSFTSEISVDGLIRDIDRTPVELRKVLKRDWKIKGNKVYWQRKWWGHGSAYDFQYSAAQLCRWGKELKGSTNQELLNRVQSCRDNVSSLIPGFDCTRDQNAAQMLDIFSDVRSNTICPIVVDEIENRWVNGKPTSLRVNPWER